jgi:hypothetical protein
MNRLDRRWLALAAAVAILAVPGCSDDSDDFSVPVDQAVEAGLNEALTTTVVPLVTFFGTIGDLLGAGAGTTRAVVECPDTSGWCTSGSVSCSVTETGLQFDFNTCQVVTGDLPFTVDGNLGAIPGATVALTLTDLVISGSPAMSGTGSIDTLACDYVLNVETSDASVSGTVTLCDGQDYPTGDQLFITFDQYLITIDFDGTSLVDATATQSANPVAFCTIDLDSQPLTSNCEAI